MWKECGTRYMEIIEDGKGQVMIVTGGWVRKEPQLLPRVLLSSRSADPSASVGGKNSPRSSRTGLCTFSRMPVPGSRHFLGKCLSRRSFHFFEGKSAGAMGVWLANRVFGHWSTVGFRNPAACC